MQENSHDDAPARKKRGKWTFRTTDSLILKEVIDGMAAPEIGRISEQTNKREPLL